MGYVVDVIRVVLYYFRRMINSRFSIFWRIVTLFRRKYNNFTKKYGVEGSGTSCVSARYLPNPNEMRNVRWVVLGMFGSDTRAMGRLFGCCMGRFRVTPRIR